MLTLRPHQERIIDRLQNYNKGQVIVPTGGGKTLTMIMDAQSSMDRCSNGVTTVVVAPRILLAEQLCSEFMEVIDPDNSDPYLHVMHVHSGETHYTSTTNADKINVFANCARNMGENCIIFTTYNSLHRIMEADIEVNNIYFDEAHNSVQRHFYGPTEALSKKADRAFFFTATRKCSAVAHKPGMNWVETYGEVIARVSAPELVDGGYILPPKVKVIEMDKHPVKACTPLIDAQNVLAEMEDRGLKKILVCVKTAKQLTTLFQIDFAYQLTERGYSYLYITAATGAVIDGRKVNREKFFETLSAWGKDDEKKFVVLHHSILSEGINVSGLNAVIFMRSMDYIGISQTIGRVIRLHKDDAAGLRNGTITPGKLDQYTKSFGLVCIPTYNKVGIQTAQKIQNVVNNEFEQGDAAVTVIKR